MKLDGATIAIEPRSVGACIDLASLFTGAHLRQLLGVTACFAGPACLLTYWLVSRLDAGLWTGLFIFFFGSPYLGAAIVAGAGHRVFGDPFTVRGTMRMIGSQLLRLFFPLLAMRVAIAGASLLCFVGAIFPAVRYGFLPEVLLLEQTRGLRCEQRIADLMRGTFFDLALRHVVISAYSLCLALSLFVLVDLVSGVVFSQPILYDRVSLEFLGDDLRYLVMHDARVITLLCAILWLVYPLGRLAWFLCYLDNRIRKEAWDVELDFRIEAQRLTPAEDHA